MVKNGCERSMSGPTADEVIELPTTSEIGTKRTSSDVRSSGAIGGIADISGQPISVAIDPTATLAVHCRNDLIVDLAPIKELVWTVHAELIEVDARKLRFKVEAHDEEVGDGTHRGAIIAIQRQG
jgi:hypothetical protein